MALTINQTPGRQETPVGQKILFSVIDTTTVATYYNVRYYCDVYFSYGSTSTAERIVTLKTTPNSSGYGIFDIQHSIEAMIKSPSVIDDTNSNVSFKGSTGVVGAPVHYVAKATNVKESSGTFYCKFYVKGSSLPSDSVVVIGSEVQSSDYTAHNIFPDSNDVMYNDGGNYYFDYDELNILPKGNGAKFLTDMPLEQNVRLNDAGTVGMFQNYGNLTSHSNVNVNQLEVLFFKSNGAFISFASINTNTASGGSSSATALASKHFNLIGVYPANIKQHVSIPAQAGYYTVNALGASTAATATYTFNIVDDCKYPNIRLAWLNKYGAWDYYNFNAKSVKTTSTNKKTFNQTQGSYQGSGFSYTTGNGGARVYDVKSTESHVLNTDYVDEETGRWLESVINSTEVYIIKDSTWELGDAVPTATNFADLIEPVMVKTSSIVSKTVQNDKLIMHTFQIEKTINNNTRAR